MAARHRPARPPACITAGELIAAERLERSNLRSKWPRAWKRASASKLRRWLRKGRRHTQTPAEHPRGAARRATPRQNMRGRAGPLTSLNLPRGLCRGRRAQTSLPLPEVWGLTWLSQQAKTRLLQAAKVLAQARKHKGARAVRDLVPAPAQEQFAVTITRAINSVLFIVVVPELVRATVAGQEGGGFHLQPFW